MHTNGLAKILLKRSIVLIVLKKSSSPQIVSLLKSLLADNDAYGIYVSFNKTYSTVFNSLKKTKVGTDSLFFVDMLTRPNAEESELDNCLFLESPEKLTGLSIALSEAIRNLSGKKKFLIFEDVESLTLYNKESTSMKFIHFLIGKLNKNNLGGGFLTRNSDSKVSDSLKTFVDESVVLV